MAWGWCWAIGLFRSSGSRPSSSRKSSVCIGRQGFCIVGEGRKWAKHAFEVPLALRNLRILFGRISVAGGRPEAE